MSPVSQLTEAFASRVTVQKERDGGQRGAKLAVKDRTQRVPIDLGNSN